MIKKITKSKITQTCSDCGISNVIDVDSLIVGTEFDKNVIMLPECSCSAQEFLNRTFDNQGEHARIVNSLHHFLCGKGKIRKEVKMRLKEEKEKPKNKVGMSEWKSSDFLENLEV